MPAERGLANWPAMRPTFTTGTPAAYVSATAICRMILSLSRIESAVKSAKDSAQSPACRRNASPLATAESCAVRWRASPAKTSGGSVASRASAFFNASASGQSGCCAAGNFRQDAALHGEDSGWLVTHTA